MKKPLNDLQKLWLEKLTDGSYQKGTDALKYEGTFCCLGVLADIMGAEWKGIDETPYIDGLVVSNETAQFLLPQVAAKAGLVSEEDQTNIAAKNDSDGYNFPIEEIKTIWRKNGYDIPEDVISTLKEASKRAARQ